MKIRRKNKEKIKKKIFFSLKEKKRVLKKLSNVKKQTKTKQINGDKMIKKNKRLNEKNRKEKEEKEKYKEKERKDKEKKK